MLKQDIPFSTSSDCTVNGTASGVGLPAQAIDIAWES